jgi:MFS family permease
METTTEQRASLWHHPNFLKLWTSDTISQFGSQFTGLALPLTAIIILHSNPFEQGILVFMGSIPWLLFGLFVGVWVDRHRKQRIMVTSNILRGSLLALIPIAAVLGLIIQLGILFLYAISFSVGFLQVFFDITYQSFLPAIVRKEQLVEGNSKLQASASVAQAAGPPLAGFVIGIITAPIAIAIDACSFFASALTLSRIEHDETLDHELSRASVMGDIREGLRLVLGDRRLRMIAGSTGTFNFFSTGLITILPFFLLYLGISTSNVASVMGLIFGVASIGALVGVLLAPKIAARIGMGLSIIGSALIGGLGGITIYLSGSLTESPLFTLFGLGINWYLLAIIAGQFVSLIGVVVYNINQVSLRQAIVPIRIQGRMNATMRFLVWGTIPLGAIAGGLLATFLGLRNAIGLSVLGESLTFLWVLLSPIRSLKEIPESIE